MKKAQILIVGFAVFFLTSNAMAGGYGPAGCGFLSTEGKSGVIAGVYDVVNMYLFGAFSITTGTSGCDVDSAGEGSAQLMRQRFIATNQAALMNEMAQGSGEHLEALAKLLGCPATLNDQFGNLLKNDYATIVTENAEPLQILSAIEAKMKADPTIAEACVL